VGSRRSARTTAAALGLAALAAALTGCGLQPATAYVPQVGPGTIAVLPDAHGAPLTVTSKNFTEQLVLGKIAVIAATAAGFTVTDLSNLPGSQPARQLLVSGSADMMWEYTGTAWLSYLHQSEVIPEPAAQWQAVHDLDLANGLTWGAPAPLNNTYALAIRSEAAAGLGGITSLSQLKDLPVSDRTFCLEAEFNSRTDGFTPMLARYGLTRGSADGVPDANIGIYDAGAVYSATDSGDCNFGEVFTTDGRIDALGLTILTDDAGYFPAYNVAPVFSSETLSRYPGLADVFAQISPRLTDEVMRTLNRRVDVDGEEPALVAVDWMTSEGFVTAAG